MPGQDPRCKLTWAQAEELFPGCGPKFDIIMAKPGDPNAWERYRDWIDLSASNSIKEIHTDTDGSLRIQFNNMDGWYWPFYFIYMECDAGGGKVEWEWRICGGMRSAP
jgi:hypothetical protein